MEKGRLVANKYCEPVAVFWEQGKAFTVLLRNVTKLLSSLERQGNTGYCQLKIKYGIEFLSKCITQPKHCVKLSGDIHGNKQTLNRKLD